MRTNEGNLDRIVRLVLAAAAAYGATSLDGVPAIVLAVVAVVFTVTAAVGFCPLYTLVGLNTCPRPAQH